MIRFLYVTAACIALVNAQPTLPRRAQPIDGFAAEVDGVVITVGDVVKSVRGELMALRGRYQGEALLEEQARAFQEGLEKLIDDQLMLAKFRKLGAQLPPGAVQERANIVMRQRFDDSRTRFQEALAAAGKTEQEWKDELQEQMIIQSMIQQYVQAPIHLAPREVRAAYADRKEEFIEPSEIELNAIAFRPVAMEDMEMREKKIEEVMRRLEAGEDFGDVARVFSEGPKAAQGGYQGWVKRETLPEPLPGELEDLQPAQRTGLIDTPVQSYIFEVIDRRGGGIMSLADAQPMLEQELRAEKYDANYDSWVQGLRKEFQIQRYNPDISAVTGDL